MNIRHAVIAVLTMAAACSAGAQTCSGGVDGGIDATGNQCSAPDAIAWADAPAAAAAPAASVASTPSASDRTRAKATATKHASTHVVTPLKPVAMRVSSVTASSAATQH